MAYNLLFKDIQKLSNVIQCPKDNISSKQFKNDTVLQNTLNGQSILYKNILLNNFMDNVDIPSTNLVNFNLSALAAAGVPRSSGVMQTQQILMPKEQAFMYNSNKISLDKNEKLNKVLKSLILNNDKNSSVNLHNQKEFTSEKLSTNPILNSENKNIKKQQRLLRNRETARIRRKRKKQELESLATLARVLQTRLQLYKLTVHTLPQDKKIQLHLAIEAIKNMECVHCSKLEYYSTNNNKLGVKNQKYSINKTHTIKECEVFRNESRRLFFEVMSRKTFLRNDSISSADQLEERNNDSLSEEDKKKRRLERNAASARYCRQRKKEYLEKLRVLIPTLNYEIRVYEKFLPASTIEKINSDNPLPKASSSYLPIELDGNNDNKPGIITSNNYNYAIIKRKSSILDEHLSSSSNNNSIESNNKKLIKKMRTTLEANTNKTGTIFNKTEAIKIQEPVSNDLFKIGKLGNAACKIKLETNMNEKQNKMDLFQIASALQQLQSCVKYLPRNIENSNNINQQSFQQKNAPNLNFSPLMNLNSLQALNNLYTTSVFSMN